MDKSSLLKIKIQVETTLYDNTKNNITREEVEDIRTEINNVINTFIVENNIV